MPELPEVETVVNQLKPIIVGQSLEEIKVFDPKLSAKGAPYGEIQHIFRSGKKIIINLSDYENAIHLRMTGRFSWEGDKNLRFDKLFKHSVPLKHLRIAFKLDRGILNFYDPRRFGTVEYGPAGTFKTKGIEPLSNEFTVTNLSPLLNKTDIKSFLLDQRFIVGIGNIYASEILFDAEISPLIKACDLTTIQLKKLISSTTKILNRAIKAGGTSISDYRHISGDTGGFQNLLKVYEQEICKKCKSEITRIVQKQRSTYFCQRCQ